MGAGVCMVTVGSKKAETRTQPHCTPTRHPPGFIQKPGPEPRPPDPPPGFRRSANTPASDRRPPPVAHLSIWGGWWWVWWARLRAWLLHGSWWVSGRGAVGSGRVSGRCLTENAPKHRLLKTKETLSPKIFTVVFISSSA